MLKISPKKRERRERTTRETYIRELNLVQREIDITRTRFNTVTERELIDQCVYELNALQSRYTYFLRLIREVEHADIR